MATEKDELLFQKLKIGELVRLWRNIHMKERNLRHPSFKVLRDEIAMRMVNIFLFSPGIGPISAYVEIRNLAECMPESCRSVVVPHFFKRMKLVEGRLDNYRLHPLGRLKAHFKEFLE
jgi:hypothetical protein